MVNSLVGLLKGLCPWFKAQEASNFFQETLLRSGSINRASFWACGMRPMHCVNGRVTSNRKCSPQNMSKAPNFLAQAVQSLQVWNREKTLPERILKRFLLNARQYLIQLGDPLVRYTFYGRRIYLPLSHDLPHFRKHLPEFLENLGRIAAAIKSVYPDLTVVDVGANVGDSAIAIYHHTQCPVLCLEGSSYYFGILRRNLLLCQSSNLVSENVIVAWKDGIVQAHLEESKGTGRLVPGGQLQGCSLKTIIDRHPRFAGFKLLKVDTDGFDLKILLGQRNLLSRLKPVVFFEYDPDLSGTLEERMQALQELALLGYDSTLVYLHTGEFLTSVSIKDIRTMEDLDLYYYRRKFSYMDLCIFHCQDQALFEFVRAEERRHSFEVKSGTVSPASMNANSR